MKRTFELGVIIGSLAGGLGLFGCAADAEVEDPAGTGSDLAPAVPDEDANAADAPSAPTAVATGASSVMPPETAYSGASRVELLTSLASTGVRITGDPSDGAFALALYRVEVGGDHATAQFMVDAAPGASFMYVLEGSGSGYSTRGLRLQRLPGSSQLEAVTATGPVACGPLANTATAVTLVYDGALHTFDVRIGGAPSACTGLSTRLKPPVIGFEVMDAANAGYGGVVTFSQLELF